MTYMTTHSSSIGCSKLRAMVDQLLVRKSSLFQISGKVHFSRYTGKVDPSLTLTLVGTTVYMSCVTLMSTVTIICVKRHASSNPRTYPIQDHILQQFAKGMLDDAVYDGNIVEWNIINNSEIKENSHGSYDDFRCFMADIMLGLS